MAEFFPPTLAAARARVAAARPAAYARTRNSIDGAVGGLSPYITHGLVSMTDVLAGVAARWRVRSVGESHLAPWLARWAECVEAPALFPPVAGRCDSFSQWWPRATRGLQTAADLLAVNEVAAC